MKRLCLVYFFLCLCAWPWPVSAQSNPATLVATLLDEAGKPLAGAEITLILIRYGELAVETKAYALCVTDFAGQCTFKMSDPPRLADGSAEAYLDVDGIGRRWVSWQGERVEITLTVADLQLQATVSVPNELGYEYETPGAYNSPPYTPAAETPSTTSEPSYTPIPASSTPTQLVLPDDLDKTQIPMQEPEMPSPRIGFLPLFCAVVLLACFGFLAWRSLRRPKQEERQ